MLRDRYNPMNLFQIVPALSFTIESVMARLDGLLDDDGLFQRLRADLAKRFPQTPTRGRPSTPVEVILRMLSHQTPIRLELRTDRTLGQ